MARDKGVKQRHCQPQGTDITDVDLVLELFKIEHILFRYHIDLRAIKQGQPNLKCRCIKANRRTVGDDILSLTRDVVTIADQTKYARVLDFHPFRSPR